MQEGNWYIATITRNGQVTIPAEVRKQLGVVAHDKLILRVVAGNRVEIEPLTMSLEHAFGSVTPLERPEDFDTLRKIAREERGERVQSKMKK